MLLSHRIFPQFIKAPEFEFGSSTSMEKGKINLTSDLYVPFKISKSLGLAVHAFVILARQRLRREDSELQRRLHSIGSSRPVGAT